MAKAKQTSVKLDMMSVVVLLVMAVFGGLIGYQLGRATAASQTVAAREAASMMKNEGTMMQSVGEMMDRKGRLYGDREMLDKAKTMMESGTMMMNKAGAMMMGY